MRTYFVGFMAEYDFPKEAQKELTQAFDKLYVYTEFVSLIENYYDNEERTAAAAIEKYRALGKEIKPLCEKTGLTAETALTVLLICVTKQTKEISKEWCWDDEMYRLGMMDIRCKLMEGYGHLGYWAVSVISWICYILEGAINSMGRLQFLYREYEGEDVELGGHTLKKGMMYIDIHIPASKESFGREARLDAYDKACKYYKKRFGDGTPFFGCRSWLLYEENYGILNEKSNIVSFMNDFKIISSEPYENKRQEMWRIFGDEAAKGELENLPENSSLQRAYKKWFLAGNSLGEGKGFFYYDDVNKDTLK